MSFDLDQLRRAHTIVSTHVPPTPQYRWPLLCEALGGEVWLKHENHTPTGAFKVRGGLTYLESIKHDPPPRLITATRGNHGQSIPYAAKLHGIPVSVLVPKGNSVEKNAAISGWGADLEIYGDDFDEARQETERRAAAGTATLVPSFHEQLILGVATYALELLEAVPDLDTIYVPIGMGSGICGLIRTRDLLGAKAEIVGVVSAQADAMAQSLERGEIVETATARTFADGVACRVPQPEAFAAIRAGAARIVRVSETDVAEAMRLLYRTTHNVAEGAGAAACAAVAIEGIAEGKKVAAILTGGNVDAGVFAQVLAGQTPG